MANGADGSITIDTELDNTGFKRGSQQTEHAVKGLINTVNRAGRDMASAVQSVNPALRDLARNSQQSGQQIANNLNAGSFGRAMTDMQKTVNSLSSQFEKMGDAERMGFKTDSQMTRFRISTEKAHETLSLLIGELNRFTNQPINTAEWERLQADMQRADAELAKLYARKDMMQDLGAKEGSAGMQRLAYQIEQAEQKYDELYNKIAEMIDRGSYAQLGGDTAQYQDMAQKIREMAAQLEYYEQIAANFNTVQNPAQESETALKGVDRELKQKPKDAGIASQALSAFGSVLARMGSYAASATAGLARLSWKEIRSGAATAANGVRSLVGHLKNLHKQGGKSALTANGLVKSLLSVKRMLLSRIKRTFISALFNSLKAGMSAFARYSSAFNAAMSSMKNSMTGLSGNLAVAAGNLVNAIAPAISTIIDWISQAITYLNAFFALLSGKSTYTVAKKGTDDYAKSLKGAGGAAKELKNEVYGFDELNKAKDDSSGGGGGAGGSVDFEEKSLADLPDNIKAFMQSLKDAFAAGEWEKIGAIVAGGLNTVVSTVDNWITGTFEPAGVKWASRVARILNGFNDAFDFYNLGSTISHGFNAILRIVNAFLTDFDAFKLGERIGDGINGITDNLDWELLGETLADGLGAAIDILAGAVTSIRWGDLGTNFGRGINAFIGNFHWEELETFVVEGINGIVEALDKVVSDEALWDNLSKQFSSSVHNIVNGVSWSKMIIVLLSGFFRIAATLATAVANLPWAKLGADFADGINKIFGNGNNEYVNWTTITDAVAKSINGITELLNKFITGVQWESIATQFAANVNSIIGGVNWGKLVLTIILGCVKLANAFFIGISSIKWSELGSKIADGLNKVFGKDEGGHKYVDWNALAKNFSESVKGILTGIDTFITETDWKQMGSTIGEALGNIDWFGIAGKLISLLWHALVTAANAAGGLIGSFITKLFGIEIIDTFSGEGINWAESLLEGYRDGLENGSMDTSHQTVQTAALLAAGFTAQVKEGLLSGEQEVYAAAGSFVHQLAAACEGEDAFLVMEAFNHYGLSISYELAEAMASSEATTLTTEAADTLFAAILQSSTAEEVIAQFAEYGIEIPQNLAEKLAQAKEPVGDAARSLLYALQQASTLEEVKLAFANAGIEVSDSFASSITGMGLDNMTAALALFGAGVDDATVAALDTSNLATNLEQYMQESGASINQVALALMVASGQDITQLSEQLGIDVGEALGGIIPESVAKALKLGKEEVKAATEEVKDAGKITETQKAEMSTSGTDAGEGTTENLAAAEKAGASEVGSESDNVAQEVKDPLSKLPEEVRPYADSLMAAVTQAIVDGNPVAVAAINAAAEEIVTTASNILTGQAGEDIINTFIGGMESKIRAMESALTRATQSAANKVVNTFKGILTIAAGRTIGQNIAQGIAAGITSTTTTIVSAAIRAAQAALAAAKSSLGIRSPSKAFAEVGDYMMQGMAVGLKEGQGNVIKTVSSVAQNAIDSAQSSAADAGASGMISGLEGVLSKLVHGIDNAISAMGGLPVPAVASGAFAPYKLRGGNGGGVDGLSNASESFRQLKDDISEELSLIREYLRQNTEYNRITSEKDLTVDGRSVEESMTSLQRSRIRSFGGT